MFSLSFPTANPSFQLPCEIDSKQRKGNERQATKAGCEIELNKFGHLWGRHQENVSMKTDIVVKSSTGSLVGEPTTLPGLTSGSSLWEGRERREVERFGVMGGNFIYL